MASPDRVIPTWINRWLFISGIITVIDGAFCLLRPHSLPGGCLGNLFYPYKFYIVWDLHYADVSDSFVWAQGLGNIIEAMLNFMVVFNCMKSVRLSKLLAIVVSTMTFWKTIIFCLYSLDVGKGGHSFDLVADFMVFAPALIWVFFPAYGAYLLCCDFCDIKRPVSRIANGNDVTDSPSPRYNLRRPKLK